MNRRTFLKGLAAVGAGLVLPPTPTENAEATRRWWSLDGTMFRPESASHITTAVQFDTIYLYGSAMYKVGETLYIADHPRLADAADGGEWLKVVAIEPSGPITTARMLHA